MSGLQAGLGSGLGVTSSKVGVTSLGTRQQLEGTSVDEEIERLQKRVKEKLLQWEAWSEEREKMGQGNGSSSSLYSLETLEERSLEGGIDTGRSRLDSVALPISLLLGASDMQAQVSEPGLLNQVGRNGNGVLGPKPSEKSSSTDLDGPVGGLWSIEAPQTGRVNWALRTGAFCLVLVPPVAVASQYPDAFFAASNIAVRVSTTFPVGLLCSS